MAGKKIFISYRRHDAGGEAGRLADLLQEAFHQDRVFMDVDTIEPGLDFVEVINNAVSNCDVLLAIIGPHWLNLKDPDGNRRIDKPDDFVKLEIAAALKRNIRIIPILVNGAIMPSSDQLPHELESITRRHAHELSSTRWKYDTDRLIEVLEKILGVQRRSKYKTPSVQLPIPPKPKSWWSKNYIWVMIVTLAIIILLSLPYPDDDYIIDSTELFETTVPVLTEAEDQQQFVQKSQSSPTSPLLSGRWSGINSLGLSYHFEISQNGDHINFTEYSYLGDAIASGSGQLRNGRDLQLTYNSIYDFTASVELTLSSDGTSLSGSINIPSQGASSPMKLIKSD